MLRPEIRLLAQHEEFRKCEAAQKSIWGGLSVSAEVMLVTQKTGGAVLGAFVDGRLAGFIYALLGRRNGRIIHWSHMMGILPAFRSQGLGFRLKLAHRELALARGVRSICWTFDPLQSRNASLNLARLGAGVEEYVVDYYGPFPSMIERGLASDRFVVNWRIASKEVEKRLAVKMPQSKIPDVPRVNVTAVNRRGFLANQKIDLGQKAPVLLVEIPPDADLMRTKDLKLARRWRLEAREVFLSYLARGYRVQSFHTERLSPGGLRCFYLLRRWKN